LAWKRTHPPTDLVLPQGGLRVGPRAVGVCVEVVKPHRPHEVQRALLARTRGRGGILVLFAYSRVCFYPDCLRLVIFIRSGDKFITPLNKILCPCLGPNISPPRDPKKNRSKQKSPPKTKKLVKKQAEKKSTGALREIYP